MSQLSIRAAIKDYPDGLTVTELSEEVKKPRITVTRMLRIMPDIYIDRWLNTKRGPVAYTAVYVLADVPADAPRPD